MVFTRGNNILRTAYALPFQKLGKFFSPPLILVMDKDISFSYREKRGMMAIKYVRKMLLQTFVEKDILKEVSFPFY